MAITAEEIASAYQAATDGTALPEMAVVNGAVLNQIVGVDRYGPTRAYIVRRLDDGTAVIVPVE